MLDKTKNEIYLQQILLTILIYSNLKLKKFDNVKKFYDHFDLNNAIFPIKFLKAKFLFLSNSKNFAINYYYKLLKDYENYDIEKDKKNFKNIITIETFHSNFQYFQNLFYYLFSLNNIDSKIKKCYFEIKICLCESGNYLKSFELIEKLYHKYSKDLMIMYECCLSAIYINNIEKYNYYLYNIKKLKEENENNEEYKKIIDNYINFCEVLFNIVERNFDEAHEKIKNILNVLPENNILKNNSFIMELYSNKIHTFKSLKKTKYNFKQLRDSKNNEDLELEIINYNIKEMNENLPFS